MNNNNKKILIGVAAVAVLCLCAGVVTVLVVREAGKRLMQSVTVDPTGMAQVSSRIADFDVPPGYRPEMAMSIFSYDYVVLVPESSTETMTFLLMQFKGMNMPDPQQMQQALEEQSGRQGIGMHVVNSYQTTIRGESTTVTIEESSAGSATAFRQLLAVFQGRQGPTMLMIQGTAGSWDQALADRFIASIR